MQQSKAAMSRGRGVTSASYVLSALPVALMLVSGIMKVAHPPMMVEGFAKDGMGVPTLVGIGVVELLSVVLYVLPRTAVLGAVLVTGYLGGAVMVHVRMGDLAFLVPLLLGMCAWGGLYLRDDRLHALLPLRKPR